ncbi:hypothetical protein KIN20_003475 [Parelaphostrongylus tenuis]|uniref:Uncharacterized protein n=1 Tax=Parelaphostrongylus tenuis TaxID=148309 RepID=A0AAD5QHF6_PARTN|nr:hypothetical protein KIN20_003475 [Parelaphostrongylus tenuis]
MRTSILRIQSQYQFRQPCPSMRIAIVNDVLDDSSEQLSSTWATRSHSRHGDTSFSLRASLPTKALIRETCIEYVKEGKKEWNRLPISSLIKQQQIGFDTQLVSIMQRKAPLLMCLYYSTK